MVVDWIFTVLSLYGTCGFSVPYILSRVELSGKPTEKIRSMKDWKDTSKVKKALYCLSPGVYLAVKHEKARRDIMEQEFIKKYNVKP
jgi:hypothetical protein